MNLEIETTLVVSASHITKEDNNILEYLKNNFGYAIVDRDDFNSAVFIDGDKDDFMETIRTLRDMHASSNLISLLDLGRRVCCTWVKFHRDGPIYDEFSTFDW